MIGTDQDLVSEGRALALDAEDRAGRRREEFLLAPADGGDHALAAYLAGNSLGLQHRRIQERLQELVADWQRWGVEGHTRAHRPWVNYHELLRGPSARLVGALPEEVVAMNSLTANLHFLMISFYRPAGERNLIVIEDTAFPSDSYAVRSQAALHGLDPDTTVLRLRPRPGEWHLRTEDVEELFRQRGHRIALVLLGAVNYYTGELLDVPAITAAGRAAGAVVAWDLAHAAGNVPLRLHDWDVDWAAWCTYKYLNGGPGAVAGAFVHQRHLGDRSLPRLEGWWSTDPATRFAMHPTLTPVELADAWQVSNPPIFAMAPVLASLEVFDEVGMGVLRARSVRLTGHLESLLDRFLDRATAHVVTPRDPDRRGAQLSVRLLDRSPRRVVEWMRTQRGVVADAREPDVVRLAPAPLYTSYHDCWRAALALTEAVDRVPAG